MLMNLNLIVPAAAAILVIIAAIVVICVLKGRNNGPKGFLPTLKKFPKII